jgi:hypothetical protein
MEVAGVPPEAAVAEKRVRLCAQDFAQLDFVITQSALGELPRFSSYSMTFEEF